MSDGIVCVAVGLKGTFGLTADECNDRGSRSRSILNLSSNSDDQLMSSRNVHRLARRTFSGRYK